MYHCRRWLRWLPVFHLRQVVDTSLLFLCSPGPGSQSRCRACSATTRDCRLNAYSLVGPSDRWVWGTNAMSLSLMRLTVSWLLPLGSSPTLLYAHVASAKSTVCLNAKGCGYTALCLVQRTPPTPFALPHPTAGAPNPSPMPPAYPPPSLPRQKSAAPVGRDTCGLLSERDEVLALETKPPDYLVFFFLKAGSFVAMKHRGHCCGRRAGHNHTQDALAAELLLLLAAAMQRDKRGQRPPPYTAVTRLCHGSDERWQCPLCPAATAMVWTSGHIRPRLALSSHAEGRWGPWRHLLANCVTAQHREEAKLHKVFLGRGDWGMTQRSEALPRTIVGIWCVLECNPLSIGEDKVRWGSCPASPRLQPWEGLAHLCKQTRVIDLGFGEDFGDTGEKLQLSSNCHCESFWEFVTLRNTSCDFEPKCCQQHTEVWERGWDMVERLWLQDTACTSDQGSHMGIFGNFVSFLDIQRSKLQSAEWPHQALHIWG